MGYIYCITNLINGKKYIGQTVRSIQDRFKDHSHQAYRPENDSRPICRAIRKYGIENFSIEQIEEVENDLLNEREIYWIQEFQTYGKNGYNATKGGDGRYTYDVDDFIHLYNMGYSCNAIAKKLGCNRPTVTRILKANGIVLKSNKRSISQYDLAGNYIQSFKTIKEAAKWIIEYIYPEDSIKSICPAIISCCKGVYKTARGYKWSYSDTDPIFIKDL